MVKNTNLFLILAGIILLLGGCGTKTVVDTTGVELVRAESLVRAAELAGADALAPAEIDQARKDLDLARAYYEWQPQTGRLSGDIKRKEDLRRQTLENSRKALASAEQALLKVNEEKIKGQSKTLSPVEIDELRASVKEEIVEEVKQQVKEEIEADLEKEYRSQIVQPQPALPPLKFSSIRGDIYRALKTEFARDLGVWGLTINRQYLSVIFSGRATAFKSGSTWVNKRMRRILEKFSPRFAEVLMRPEFRDHIKEIRVEGFSSTNYRKVKTQEERNHLNLLLSQERTANVLRFVLKQPKLKNNKWFTDRLLPVGFDGKNPVMKNDGSEDEVLSRRVEFRVITQKPKGFR